MIYRRGLGVALKISMTILRRNVDNINLFPLYYPPKKVMPYIYEL